MPKLRVERTMDYRLRTMMRGEMAAQHVTVEKAAVWAGVSTRTLYSVFEMPSAYMDKALRLMRHLSIPIEEVRAAISYPW